MGGGLRGLKLLKNAHYTVEFAGPASVYKYRLTPEGPQELGIFTHPDLFRLTNIHIFYHQGKKILTAIGSPNYIFVFDADNMKFIKKIEVYNTPSTSQHRGNYPCVVGTFSPAKDGEKIYVQANRSFQVVDIASGEPDLIRELHYNHSCANHMLTSKDSNW